jgi:hypothetical protein
MWGLVQGGDLLAPPHDRAAELADLGRALTALEVVAEGGDELGLVISLCMPAG